MSPTLGVQRARCLSVCQSVCLYIYIYIYHTSLGRAWVSPTLGVQRARCLSVCQSVCLYIYIYISYVRHFWSRGPRATRKRKPAHLKFKDHLHACCIITHVQQLSDNQQRRLEAETTHEREERLQQLSAAQVRS